MTGLSLTDAVAKALAAIQGISDTATLINNELDAARAEAAIARSDADQGASKESDAMDKLEQAERRHREAAGEAGAEIAGLKADNEFLAKHDAEMRTEVERLRQIINAKGKVAQR